MTTILFVDDDKMLMNGLRRMLHKHHDRWELSFACSGQQALETMESNTFDVVISDMRMPGMNGNQLLETVRERHPGTVRVILSGAANKALILESTRLAHLFLTKPCEAGELEATIERCCQLRSLLQDEALVGFISKLTTFPSLPELYSEIIELIEGDEWSLQDVGQIIARDFGMTAKVLQLVNSSFFGLRRHIDTTDDAVSYLGVETIKSLVLSVNLFSQFSEDRIGTLKVRQVANHNIATGMLARVIASAEQAPKAVVDQAFLAGTLHDAGRLILAANAPEQYAEVLALVEAGEAELCEAERRVIGSTHSQVGAYLLSLWGLPRQIVSAVAHHHDPAEVSGDGFTALTAVHVSSAVESSMNPALTVEEGKRFMQQIDQAYLERLGLLDRLPTWIASCQSQPLPEKAA